MPIESIAALLVVASSLGAGGASLPSLLGPSDFDALSSATTGASPTRLDVGDVDEDGLLDVVAAHDRSSFAILRGDALLGLVPIATHALAGSVNDVALLDVDGDSHLDVGLARADGFVDVWRGDGSGGFRPLASVAVGGYVTAVAGGDFDGDGRDDLVATRFGDLMTGVGADALLVDAGMGGFAVAGPFPVGSAATEVVVADLDADGALDALVAIGAGSRAVALLFGDGAGGLEGVRLAGPLTNDAGYLATADFDGDGVLDIAVSSGSVSVLLGDGSRNFRLASTRTAGGGPIDVADFDEDGTPDVLIATPDGLVLRRSDGLGDFRSRQDVFLGYAARFGMAARDFDVDGDVDVALGNHDNLSVTLVHEEGPGTWRVPRLSIQDPHDRILAAADFDGNGTLDVAAASRDAEVAILAGDGTGRLLASSASRLAFQPIDALALDADEDGATDLVVVEEALGPSDGTLQVLLNDGAGRLVPEVPVRVGRSLAALAELDVDGDGHADVVVAKLAGENAAIVLRGDGRGGFSPLSSLVTGAPAADVACGDFDEDGNADVALLSGGLHLFFGDGAGAFPSSRLLSAETVGKSIESSDLDGDGHLDFVVVSAVSEVLTIAWGDGAGSLAGFERLSAGRRFERVAIADLDRDGRMDLCAASPISHDVFLFAGSGGRAFRAAGALAGLVGPPVLLGDLDGDSLPDLIAPFVSSTSRGIGMYRNDPLDPLRARRGVVNAARGPIADVLLVNGSPGSGQERVVILDRTAPFVLALSAPPSDPTGPAGAVTYAYVGEPTASSVTRLPLGLGTFARGTPLTGRPVSFVANSAGHPELFGVERWPGGPTSPAPTVLLDRPSGLGRPGVFYFQSIVIDGGAPNGRAAATNGVVVRVL